MFPEPGKQTDSTTNITSHNARKGYDLYATPQYVRSEDDLESGHLVCRIAFGGFDHFSFDD